MRQITQSDLGLSPSGVIKSARANFPRTNTFVDQYINDQVRVVSWTAHSKDYGYQIDRTGPQSAVVLNGNYSYMIIKGITPEPVGALKKHAATILGFSRITKTPPINIPESKDVFVEMITAPLDKNNKPIFEESESSFINVATIPFYQVRTIWKNGRPTREKRSVETHTVELDVTRINNSIFYVGDLPELNDGFEKIKNQAFRSLRSARVYKTEIELNGEKSILIVPCAEILNFYFKSNYLISCAFSGEAVSETLYWAKDSVLNAKPPYIHLRKKVPDILVYHVARLVLDPIATSRYENIHGFSLNPNFAHRKFGYSIWAVPPLQGGVKWELEIFKSKNICFVSKILTCSGSFPFDQLVFGRENDGRSIEGRPEPRSINRYPRLKPKVEPGKTRISPYKPPTEQLSITELLIDDPNCPFPGLSNTRCTKIEKLEILDPDSQNISIFEGELAYKYLSVSEIYSGFKEDGLGGKINFHSQTMRLDYEEILEPDPSFEQFKEVATLLRTEEVDVTFCLINQPNLALSNFYENLLPFHENEDIPSWVMKPTSERGETFQSKLKTYMLLKVTTEDRVVIVVEFMQRKNATASTILFCCLTRQLSNTEIESEIKTYSKNRLNWHKNVDAIDRRKCSHIEDTAEARTARLSKEIKAIINQKT